MDFRSQLAEFIFNPHRQEAVLSACRGVLPDYPKNGCALTVCKVLQNCGADCPDTTWAEDLAHLLLTPKRGRKVSTPQFGDVFVSTDLNGNGAADHIGFYLGTAPGPLPGLGSEVFLALDNRTIGRLETGCRVHPNGMVIPVYCRNMKEGKYTPVDYFIRLL